MIIKFMDTYLSSPYTIESVRHYIERNLEEHVRESSDFDVEHFVEILQDTGNFEVLDGEHDFSFEFTQDEVDIFVDKILEEMYEEEYNDSDDDDDEDEDDDYDNDYSDDEDEEDDF